MFPPLPIRCLCRCIHVSGFLAFSSLFFSSLCLICGFLPAIANLKQPFSLASTPSLPLPVPPLLISTLQSCFLWWTPIIQPGLILFIVFFPPSFLSVSPFFPRRYWRGFIHVVVHSTGRNPFSRHLVTSIIIDTIITIEAPVGKSPSPQSGWREERKAWRIVRKRDKSGYFWTFCCRIGTVGQIFNRFPNSTPHIHRLSSLRYTHTATVLKKVYWTNAKIWQMFLLLKGPCPW